ncbi:MAG: CoA-binding protein [Bacillota bacterium]|nr:CoA-binding protein [Bacillota bacterium]
MKITKTIDDIFHPRSIAVVGASQNPRSQGYQYLRFLLDYGYRGAIYPVNLTAMDILGILSYPSLKEIPGNVDYVICCINAALVRGLLEECFLKKVKAVHLFTAQLSETGDQKACLLEEEIKKDAQKLGIRLIGPNCMGIYNPRERIAFNHDLCMEPGSVGAIVQSGGLAGEIVRLAALRGVRFSKVVSYGNAVDLNETDFLEYFLWDKETKVILVYIEGTRNGRKLFKVLRRAAKIKPVIILKGGRSRAGIKSVASHTASMAGSIDTWQVVFRQTKVVQANTLNELIDLAAAFYFLPPITGKRVGIVGGGGGKSVLASDEYEEAGLEVIPIPEDIVKFLESKNPKITGWLCNPIDASILATLNLKSVDILRCMAESPEFDLLSVNTSEDSLFPGDLWVEFIEGDANGCMMVRKEGLKPIVAVVGNPEIGVSQTANWRWQTLSRLREQLTGEGVPVFSSPGRAAVAISKLVDYYQYWKEAGDE